MCPVVGLFGGRIWCNPLVLEFLDVCFLGILMSRYLGSSLTLVLIFSCIVTFAVVEFVVLVCCLTQQYPVWFVV